MSEALFVGLAKEQLGLILGIGVGSALAAVLEPEIVSIRQATYKGNPNVAPDVPTLAAGVAQGQVDRGEAAEWASEHGIGAEAFEALVNIANTGPALGAAYQAWRRDELTDDDFTTALRRTGLEEHWYTAMRSLKEERLDLGAIATAIHRGIMRGPGLIIREPPTEGGRVPAVPQSPIDPVKEAQAHGVSAERLRVLVGNTGLPPGLMEMLRLLNMGKVTEDDVRRAVAQSNLRNEYMDVVLELRRRVLTPHEYIEARLRGWIDDSAMHAGAALSGMRPDDADLLAKLSGRPLSFHQVFIGLRRGGKYDGPTAGIDPAFLKSLQESNVRPEWYDLAWAQRYNYPSAFVLRQLAAAGELTAAEAERILLYQGWEPTLAHKIAGRWAGGAAGAGKEETKAELADEFEGGYLTEAEYRKALTALGYDGHAQDLLVHLGDARRAKRYREKAVDAIAAAYTSFKITDAHALAELAEVNVAGKAAQLLLGLWGKQRLDTIRLLTPAQIKKAFTHGLIDRAKALQALEWEHFTATDAATLLDE